MDAAGSDTPIPRTKHIHKRLGKRLDDYHKINDKLGIGASTTYEKVDQGHQTASFGKYLFMAPGIFVVKVK